MNHQLAVKKINEHLYRFQEDSEFINVDSYLLCGSERAMVIDGLQVGEGLYRAVREITDKPVFMVITHAHPDHIGNGLKEFLEAGCTVYFSEKEGSHFEDIPEDQYFRCVYQKGDAIASGQILNLEEGMEFDLGNLSLEVMSLPGHSVQIKPYAEPGQDYLDSRYVNEYRDLISEIVDGRLIGEKIQIPMDIMKGIQIRKVTGACVGELCYDSDKLR